MKNIKYISFLIAIVLQLTNAESQNPVLISGTGMTIQNGISVYGLTNLTIADKGTNKAYLNNSGIINLTGNLINSSLKDSLGKGNLSFTGVIPQNITGTNTFGDVTFDKSSGDISLSGNMTVTGQMKFINGVLNTSDENTLTLGQFASVNGATSSDCGANDLSYVNGPMIKAGNTNFIFPIGKKTAQYPLHPLGIEFSEGSIGSFKAEYINNLTLNAANKPDNVMYVSQSEYWILNQVDGRSTAYITLGMRDVTVNNPNNYLVLNLDPDNSVWKNAGNTAFQMTNQNYEFLRSGLVHNFTQFTYGSMSASERMMLQNNSNSLDMKVFPNPSNGTDIKINIKKK
jgi:hypothetical protein